MSRLAATVALALILGGCSTGAGRDPVSGPSPTVPSVRPMPSEPSSPSPREPGQDAPTRFRVASYNVLGSSHTRLGGRWQPGSVRARWAADILERNYVDVVGLQEFERSQLRSIRKHAGGSWGFYPAMQHGERALANSIAWRADTWKLTDGRLFDFPYFGGRLRQAPAVVLENRRTGKKVAFVNVHNPATTRGRGDHRQWRRKALGVELRQIRSLVRQGLPVILTGDFNEVRPVYCRLAGAAMVAASGEHREGRCQPPPDAGVDAIFGTRDVRFDGYTRRHTQLGREASDHPIVFATAVIGP